MYERIAPSDTRMGELEQTLKKKEEQFPLLKVVVTDMSKPGIGDGCRVRAPRSILNRFSEYTSTFGLTLMLLGVSVLGIYSLSMLVNGRQSLLTKYINAKYNNHLQHHYIGGPTNDVFYHKIVSNDQEIAFHEYLAYLSDMALKYPYLKFKVIFLIDDTFLYSYPGSMHRHSSRLARKILQKERKLRSQPGVPHDEVADFLKKYPNVEITTKLLSKHMDSTPLKYKWRIIPLGTLQYYCGVNAVWRFGGIALDLDSFNNIFTNQLLPDKRILMIFDRHHEGVPVKRSELDNAPRSWKYFDHDDSDALALLNFFSIWPSLFPNETEHYDVVAKDTPLAINSEEQLVRKHRDKRELADQMLPATTDPDLTKEIEFTKLTREPNSETTADTDVSTIVTEAKKTPEDITRKLPKTIKLDKLNSLPLGSFNRHEGIIKDVFTIFMDFGLNMDDGVSTDLEYVPMSDPFKKSNWLKGRPDPSMRLISQPTRPIPDLFRPSGDLKCKPICANRQPSLATDRLAVLEAEGKFLSSSVRYNPFLGHMIHSVSHVSDPRGIIESVLAKNCYAITGEASFCNDIYFL